MSTQSEASQASSPRTSARYRLRVGDEIRVFYDVTEEVVQVLAIVPKSETEAWLAKHGKSDETSSSV